MVLYPEAERVLSMPDHLDCIVLLVPRENLQACAKLVDRLMVDAVDPGVCVSQELTLSGLVLFIASLVDGFQPIRSIQ